jgi:putative SOS response-associated peptidase YedK
MAGLWSRWHDMAGGEELWSSTVIVKDADDWYSRFHDRMAVLLAPESYEQWLDPQQERGQLELLSKSAYHKNDELEFFPISTLVNNSRNDSPDCLEEVTPSELAKTSELLLDL